MTFDNLYLDLVGEMPVLVNLLLETIENVKQERLSKEAAKSMTDAEKEKVRLQATQIEFVVLYSKCLISL